LIVNVPQLTSNSGNDICLKKDGVLCIVMVVKNSDSVNKEQMDQISQLGEEFESKISRGISFNFMWLDASAEKEFADVFDLGDNLPSVVVLNPGKRKRFLVHNGEISKDGVQKTIDTILGGDARFKTIKGNKLPALVSLYPVD
jgi:hypothetical protein